MCTSARRRKRLNFSSFSACTRRVNFSLELFKCTQSARRRFILWFWCRFMHLHFNMRSRRIGFSAAWGLTDQKRRCFLTLCAATCFCWKIVAAAALTLVGSTVRRCITFCLRGIWFHANSLCKWDERSVCRLGHLDWKIGLSFCHLPWNRSICACGTEVWKFYEDNFFIVSQQMNYLC